MSNWSKVTLLEVGSAQIPLLICMYRQYPLSRSLLHILEVYSRKRDTPTCLFYWLYQVSLKPVHLCVAKRLLANWVVIMTRPARGRLAHWLYYLWFTLGRKHIEQGGSESLRTRDTPGKHFTFHEDPSAFTLGSHPSHFVDQLEVLWHQSGNEPWCGRFSLVFWTVGLAGVDIWPSKSHGRLVLCQTLEWLRM